MASPVTKAPPSAEYIAALCHWRNGVLVDYDSTRFVAASEPEAKRKAAEWAAANLGPITEKTWLQVTRALDGKSIHSKVFGEF
jgi:hypothetical protein